MRIKSLKAMDEPHELSEEDRKRLVNLHKDEGCILHGSKDSPIVVQERRTDAQQYILWEYEYVARELGPKPKHLIQSLLVVGEKQVDRLLCEDGDGRRHAFYFDVTAQLEEQILLMKGAALGEPVAMYAPKGPRTRFVAIWHPGFENGMSRFETMQTLKMAWAATAPEMAARREVVTRDTPNPEILRRVDEWLLRTWSKTLGSRKRLSVVVITDPAWEESKDRFETSTRALAGGYAYGREKPQFCVIGLEAPEGI